MRTTASIYVHTEIDELRAAVEAVASVAADHAATALARRAAPA